MCRKEKHTNFKPKKWEQEKNMFHKNAELKMVTKNNLVYLNPKTQGLFDRK